MVPSELDKTIIDILRQRMAEDGGEEHYERTRALSEMLFKAGLLHDARASFERLRRVNAEDQAVISALIDIEGLLN